MRARLALCRIERQRWLCELMRVYVTSWHMLMCAARAATLKSKGSSKASSAFRLLLRPGTRLRLHHARPPARPSQRVARAAAARTAPQCTPRSLTWPAGRGVRIRGCLACRRIKPPMALAAWTPTRARARARAPAPAPTASELSACMHADAPTHARTHPECLLLSLELCKRLHGAGRGAAVSQQQGRTAARGAQQPGAPRGKG